MTFNSGTDNDYQTMLDTLVDVLTSRHLSAVVINAGGTGHAVGDILDITATGSTSTHVCKVQVVTLSGSAIATLRIYRGGAYTVDPTTIVANAQSATTGSGTGATFDLTFAETGWSVLTRRSELDTVDTIAAGGNNYSAADVLTVVGGVISVGGAAATITVDTVSSGVVSAVTLLTRGDYEVFPTDPVLTTVSPSGGIGCTLTLTPRDWPSGEDIVILQGDAGASTDPIIGIKTYADRMDETETDTVYNWAMFSMTSWDAGQPLHEQPNLSPGFQGSAGLLNTTIETGAFVPLKDNDAFNIQWTIRATGRSFVLNARVGDGGATNYAVAAGGLLNQFGVTTEFPFPAFVAGTSCRPKVYYLDPTATFGGLSVVLKQSASQENGPMFVWAPEGAWLEAVNCTHSGNQGNSITFGNGVSNSDVMVGPLAHFNDASDSDDIIWANANSTLGYDQVLLTLAVSPIRIFRTPDTGGDLTPLYPLPIIQTGSGFERVLGEIDGAFWFGKNDLAIVSQDRFTQAGDAFTVYQNGKLVTDYAFMAIRED